MKKLFLPSLFLSFTLTALAQNTSLEGERSMWSIRSSEYPRVTSDHRAMFKVKAPEANSVQLDLGKKYEMYNRFVGTWVPLLFADCRWCFGE